MESRTWSIISLSIVALLCGCSGSELTGLSRANEAPQVWLSCAPPEGTTANYRVRLYWGGWDPDGNVAYYQYAITDNKNGTFDPADTVGTDKWHRVYSNDSTLTFTADMLADSTTGDPDVLLPVNFVRSHTFFIRAVDERGLASTSPAYRSFTATTLCPVVDVLVPVRVGTGAAPVLAISTFSWLGQDYTDNGIGTQDPDSVRWILVSALKFNGSFSATIDYIRKHPRAPEWSAWCDYGAPDDSGKQWTTPALGTGPYVFAVQVKDDAGAISAQFDQRRNVRLITVTPRSTGPMLAVSNRYMGTIMSSNPTTPPAIMDVLPGVPMQFRFTADASRYGGVVSGYRYGWDVQDVDDPADWEVDYTPFVLEANGKPMAMSPPREWQYDTHSFDIEVIDNSGYSTMITVTLNIVPFTMQKSVLMIDDYDESPTAGFGRTNGGAPSDEEHDAFWVEMLEDVRGFDPTADMIEVETDLPLQILADYRSIIWDAYSSYNMREPVSLLPEIIRFIPTDPELGGSVTGKVKINALAFYVAAGGHVLLCGNEPMTAAINWNLFSAIDKNPVYPLIFRYELTCDQLSPYEDSEIGTEGVGELSFPYSECCLNVLDINAANRRAIRSVPQNSCSVATVRRHDSRTDGLRFAIPMDGSLEFPTLELRPEVALPGRVYAPEARGLVSEIYNPPYFQQICPLVAETNPLRSCFQPIYGHGCLDATSSIYGAPVAYWTGTYGTILPDVPGGVAARSAVMGFDPVFFTPEQVKQALDIILLEEWKLPRRID